ncbi:uncharacterized protein EV154DRAFT_489019 [Mucor mucedo]|uniref:uncharacterized protein n=1 Tax=Mucor mucedo TaxID=29922 RepID=UPI00221EC597|nr:uncharacterized protein EV154DRAFT_489019 [Mucor mucedo]KAI7863752.1 hypothetical protein EV154DRAFT_489019 [Mucor mucedo]
MSGNIDNGSSIWSLDLQPSQQPEELIPSQAMFFLNKKYETEVAAIREQHAMWISQQNELHSQQIKRMEQEVTEQRIRWTEQDEKHMNEMKAFNSVELLRAEVNQLRRDLGESIEQLKVKNHKIENYEIQIDDLSSRCSEYHKKNNQLMDDLAKSQITCDRRRVENRRLLTKLEENSKSTPLYEQQTTLETQEQPLMQRTASPIPLSLHHTEKQQEENSFHSDAHSTYSNAVNWDNFSVGSATPSQNFRAQQFSSSHHVNSGQATAANPNKQNRRKHPTPPFNGVGRPIAQECLANFRKLIVYHKYTDDECIDEFMMAMQSYANKWWATVDEATRTDFQAIVTAFQAFYGGEDEAMAKAIAAMRTMKQSDEAMTSFGTRLLLEVTTIAKDNSQLQLNYVYGAVNTSVSEAVLPTRPKNILEAIGVAIEVEQNIRYSSFHSSNSTAKIPSAAKIWPPMGTESRGDDPMECDINAQQYRGGKSFQTKGNSNKSRQCFICERTNHVAKIAFC